MITADGSLEIHTVPVTPFQQNARIVTCCQSGATAVVDPGGDVELIVAQLRSAGRSCSQIWLTHSHLDHCAGVAPLLKALGGTVELVAHPAEAMMRAQVQNVARLYGLGASEWHNCPEPTVPVSGGELITLGRLSAEVLFTPGHSPGHVGFFFRAQRVLLSGDALFAGSIGRTDLPGGDHATLLRSIREQILVLPDDVLVLSGHGDDTSVGEERRSNPFLS